MRLGRSLKRLLLFWCCLAIWPGPFGSYLVAGESTALSIGLYSETGSVRLRATTVMLSPLDQDGRSQLELVSDDTGFIIIPPSITRHRWPSWRLVSDGYVPEMIDLAAAFTGEGSVQKDVRLKKAASGGGTVLDESGNPVQGAQVVIVGPADSVGDWFRPHRCHIETTGADGRWRCRHLPVEGPTKIVVVHSQFAVLQAGPSKSAGGTSFRLDELTAQRAVLFLGQGRGVTGRIVDQRGRPVEGASIWSGHYPLWTPADGEFAIRQTLGVPLPVLVQKAGFAIKAARIDLLAGEKLAEIPLEAREDVKVKVVDEDNVPVVDARVRMLHQAHALDWFQSTDKNGELLGLKMTPDGRFSVSDVPPGNYRLRVHFHEAKADGTGVNCLYRVEQQLELPAVEIDTGKTLRDLGVVEMAKSPAVSSTADAKGN